jgi:phosphopantothenoylcysteine decarboxylase/phosphopantothenate--cysteine ligase
MVAMCGFNRKIMENKNILIAVTGGIAAYKACELVRLLVKNDLTVKVMMTQNAVKLVSPLTFKVLSKNQVCTDDFLPETDGSATHIALAKWAGAVVVAPATANTIGKFVNGIADNFVTTTLMAVPETTPLFFAPAMNDNMWNNVFVRENMKKLAVRKSCHVIGPESGMLADGSSGIGRMSEPGAIMECLGKVIAN